MGLGNRPRHFPKVFTSAPICSAIVWFSSPPPFVLSDGLLDRARRLHTLKSATVSPSLWRSLLHSSVPGTIQHRVLQQPYHREVLTLRQILGSKVVT